MPRVRPTSERWWERPGAWDNVFVVIFVALILVWVVRAWLGI